METSHFHISSIRNNRSETIGIAERVVRRVNDGTQAVLLQSGLDERWWSDSLEWYCYLRNVQDLLADGKTSYERRFGESFKGPITPFGAMVECHPISPKDQARVHQLGKKVLPGIFLGYELVAGRIWKGDILIADLEDLENGCIRYLSSKNQRERILIRQKDDEFIFPVADGTAKLSVRDYEFRVPTLRREPTVSTGRTNR